jgi:hypothetical protein
MAAGFSLVLRHFGMSRNLKRQWPGLQPFSEPDVWNFHSSRRTSPVSWSEHMTIERLLQSI